MTAQADFQSVSTEARRFVPKVAQNHVCQCIQLTNLVTVNRVYVELSAHISPTFISATSIRRRETQRLHNSPPSNTATTQFAAIHFSDSYDNNVKVYFNDKTFKQFSNNSPPFISATLMITMSKFILMMKLSNSIRETSKCYTQLDTNLDLSSSKKYFNVPSFRFMYRFYRCPTPPY